jgi:hypothetical protein
MVLEFNEKELAALAFKEGEFFLSEETGYIHFNKSHSTHAGDKLVPFYENILYCLSLFKTHEKEKVQLAKEKLFALLKFQSPLGGLPSALHLFPEEASCSEQISILIPLMQIVNSYGKLFKASEKETLCAVLESVIARARTSQSKEGYLSYFRWGQVLIKAASLLHHSALEKEGREAECFCFAQGMVLPWYNPEVLAQMIEALLLNYETLMQIPSDLFINYLSTVWNRELGVFIGAEIRPLQYENSGAPTFFDLLISLEKGELLHNLVLNKGYFLRGLTLRKAGMPCNNSSSESITILDPKHFHFPWRTFWREGKQVASLVCYTKSQEVEVHKLLETTVLTLRTQEENDEPIELFFSDVKGVDWKVVERKATVFHVGCPLTIETENVQFKITFHAEHKDAYLCHIMRADRPGQQSSLKGFDFKIFIRSLKNRPGEKISVEIERV